MQNCFMRSILAVVVLAFTPVILAQNPAGTGLGAAEVKAAPRLPDGKPDLSGVWDLQGSSRFFGQRTEEMARNRQEPPVTIAEMALTPAAAEKYKAQLQAGKIRTVERDLLDPSIRACAPVGLTRILSRPFEIIHLPGRTLLRYERGHWVHDVWMDGREHPKDQPTRWMGHSIGHWDGDTLVVDTVGFNDLTWLDSPGHPHSEDLHLVARYTRVNHDTLEIQITFEDPQVYTKPLVGNTLTFRLMPGGEIMEWVNCEERIRLLLETDPCEITGPFSQEI